MSFEIQNKPALICGVVFMCLSLIPGYDTIVLDAGPIPFLLFPIFIAVSLGSLAAAFTKI